MHRGNSVNRKRIPLGTHRRPAPRVIGESQGDGHCLMGEGPLWGLGFGVSEPPPVAADGHGNQGLKFGIWGLGLGV